MFEKEEAWSLSSWRDVQRISRIAAMMGKIDRWTFSMVSSMEELIV